METKKMRVEVEDWKTRIEADKVVIVMVKEKLKGGKWTMLFQDFLEKIAKDKEINGADYRVLNYLLAHMDYENWIQVTQKTIGEELGIKTPNVRRSIKKLQEKGIIEVARRGGMNLYRISLDFVWKGKIKNLRKQKVIPFEASLQQRR